MREGDACALDEFRWCGLQTSHKAYVNSISLMSIDTTTGVGAELPSGLTWKDRVCGWHDDS